MKKNNIIYPVLDEKREKRVPVCTERLLYGESEYFFSPEFKKSEEVIKGILRGYIPAEDFKTKISSKIFGPGLMVKPVFDKNKKLQETIKGVVKELSSELKVCYGDIIAYYKNDDYQVLLTKDRFLSTYRSDREPHNYLDYPIRDITFISPIKIREDGGMVFQFPEDFSDDFMGLVMELKDLNREREPMPYKHPLNGEKREMRESYVGILVDKSLADGSLSSNEVVRLEILARQMGIDSGTVLEQIDAAIRRYDQLNIKEDSQNAKEYIYESLKQLTNIENKYYYMLYHDVITFELLSNKGEVAEQISEFSKTLSKRCDIDDRFQEKYSAAMQKLVVSSYTLRDSMQSIEACIEDKEAYRNLFKSVEYEYNLQKELLQ